MLSPNSSSVSEEWWQDITMPIFVTSIHVMNYLLGLPLNSYIITLLLSGRRSLDPCDVFTLNQAVAETVFMLLGPFHVLLSFGSETWCYQPMGLFLGMGMSVRALLQCWVSLERYVAVLHPVTFLKLRPLRYRVGVCTLTWAVGLAVGLTCMITFPDMPYKVYGVMYFFILSINVFSCVSVLNALRHPAPGQRNAAGRGTDAAAKKRAFRVIVLNLLAFLVQNAPIAVLFGIQNMLSMVVFKTLMNISLAVSLIVGYVQPLSTLRKAGKLSCHPSDVM